MKFIRFFCLLFFILSSTVQGQGIFNQIVEQNTTEKLIEQAYSKADTEPVKALKEAEDIMQSLPKGNSKYTPFLYNIFSKAALNQGAPEKAKEWGEKALKLSESMGSIEGQLLSKHSLASVYIIQNDIDKALEQGKSGMAKAEENKLDYYIMAFANVVGTCQTRKGEYDTAIKYYQQALDYAQTLNDISVETKMLNNLSSLLIITKELEKGLEILEKGINLAEKQNNKGNMAVLLLNKAFVLADLGKIEEQTQVLNQTLSLAKEMGYLRVEGASLTNLADLYLQKKDYKKAAEMAKQALNIAEKMGEKPQIIVNKVTYAQAKSYLGFHDEALKLLNEALVDFQKAGMEAEVIQVTEYLSEAYEEAGNTSEALKFHKAFKEKSDALFQNEKQKIVTELNTKYETEQKEKEIILLNKDNQQKQAQRNIGFVIAISFILIAFLILLRLKTSRKINNQLKIFNEKLNELSLKDTLTGLYNRRYFLSHIDSHVAYARRKNEDLDNMTGKLGFMMIDIDHFKKVNDNEGHHAGDKVLKEFSCRLGEVFRESDVVVRWGGEEFLAVVRDATFEGTGQLAERILKSISNLGFLIENKELIITCSIGYCCFPFTDNEIKMFSWEKTIIIADNALYKAKSSGRNRAIGVKASFTLQTNSEAELVLNNFDNALQQKVIEIETIEG